MPFIQLPAKKGFGVEVEFDVRSTLFEKKRVEFEFIANHNIQYHSTNNCFILKPDRAVCGGYIGEIMELNAGIYPLTGSGINLFINHLSKTYKDMKMTGEQLFAETCGIHVHFSWDLFPSDETRVNFIRLFAKFEKDIYKYCAHSSRTRNMYVVPLSRLQRTEGIKSGDSISSILFHIRESWGSHHTSVNNHRRASLEIRHMGSTTNLDSIKNWIELLRTFYQISINQDYGTIFDGSDTLLDLVKNSKTRSKKRLSEWVMSKDPNKFSYDFQ
jgi:hypothetical protein